MLPPPSLRPPPKLFGYLDDWFGIFANVNQFNAFCKACQAVNSKLGAGLVINMAKCWCRSIADVKQNGASMLGSVVGGPLTDNQAVDELFQARIERMRTRVTTAAKVGLPKQHRLLLLRQCFFPILGHLLRVLPPETTLMGARAFDDAVAESLQEWFGRLNHHSLKLASLPTRMGGLGLLCQEKVAPLAAAASYALSHHVLSKRLSKYHLGVAMPKALGMVEAMTMCAVNLNIGLLADALLDEKPHHLKQMQRNACKLPFELEYLDIWQNMDQDGKKRLVEATTRVARAWLRVIPAHPRCQLTDAAVDYGVKRTLVHPFLHTVAPSRVCPACRHDITPQHHLECFSTRNMRNARHHAICRVLKTMLSQVIDNVQREITEGGLQHDIMYIIDSTTTYIDVGITTVSTTPTAVASNHGNWPTEDEVQVAVNRRVSQAEIDARRHDPDAELPRRPHPDVERGEMRRELQRTFVIGQATAQTVRNKNNHFAQRYVKPPTTASFLFVPFIMTAGGGLNPKANEVMEVIADARFDADRNKLKMVRQRWLSRYYEDMATELLRYAAKMATSHSMQALR